MQTNVCKETYILLSPKIISDESAYNELNGF